MDCMQLQDRREKNFLLDNEVPTMDNSNVLPTGNYIYSLGTRVQSTKFKADK